MINRGPMLWNESLPYKVFMVKELLCSELVKYTYKCLYIAMFITYYVYLECRGLVKTNVVRTCDPHCCKFFGKKICLN